MSDTGGGHRASAKAIEDALNELYPNQIEVFICFNIKTSSLLPLLCSLFLSSFDSYYHHPHQNCCCCCCCCRCLLVRNCGHVDRPQRVAVQPGSAFLPDAPKPPFPVALLLVLRDFSGDYLAARSHHAAHLFQAFQGSHCRFGS